MLTGFAIYTTDVIVFGLLYWELDAGGPAARSGSRRTWHAVDFHFPQDEQPRARRERLVAAGLGLPYVSLTNSIAFSPTDHAAVTAAKASMGLESAISAVAVLLVAARAVNVLGT